MALKDYDFTSVTSGGSAAVDSYTVTPLNAVYSDASAAVRKEPSTFADDSEFREFMIWLCGFTDATEAPEQEAWERLRERVKEVAASYAQVRRHLLKGHGNGTYPTQEQLLDFEKACREAEFDELAKKLQEKEMHNTRTWISDNTVTPFFGVLTKG